MIPYYTIFFQRNRGEYHVFSSLTLIYIYIFGYFSSSLGFENQLAGQSILVVLLLQ